MFTVCGQHSDFRPWEASPDKARKPGLELPGGWGRQLAPPGAEGIKAVSTPSLGPCDLVAGGSSPAWFQLVFAL